ncbi:MAG: S1 RNA-binding domain-containing protein [Candidatus Obscuribacterales bacterium]|nr:S1 RNA-binding domain-containing protein [Candidatus Obscuribacterales bacterium]
MSHDLNTTVVASDVAAAVAAPAPAVTEQVAPGVTEIRVGEPGAETVGLVIGAHSSSPAPAKPQHRGPARKTQPVKVAVGERHKVRVVKKLDRPDGKPGNLLVSFIEVGGRNALVPVSELHSLRVKDRDEQYANAKPGDEFDAVVLTVNEEEGRDARIIASRKQLLLDKRVALDTARDQLIAGLEAGKLIPDAVVVGEYFGKMADGRKLCGHFVRIASAEVDGELVVVDGLLHFRGQLPSSEAERGPEHADLPVRSENLVIGQTLNVLIDRVTVKEPAVKGERGQTLFSLSESGAVRLAQKQAREEQAGALLESLAVGSYCQGRVVRDLGVGNGLVVTLDAHGLLEAFLPEANINAPRATIATVGKTIYTKVTEIKSEDASVTVKRVNAGEFRNAEKAAAAEATSSDESAS